MIDNKKISEHLDIANRLNRFVFANLGKSINGTVGDPLTTFDKHLNGQKPNTS